MGEILVRPAGKGAILYEEGANRYTVSVVEGGGYSIIVEEMGDADISLSALSIEDRLRIAKNIERYFRGEHVQVDIQLDNRIISD